MQQIPVRAVQLKRVHPDAVSAPGGGGKGVGNAGHLGQAQFGGRRLPGQLGQGRRAKGFPATVRARDQLPTLPRNGARALATGMGELQAHGSGRRQLAGAPQHVGQRCLGAIVPQAQAGGRDAPLRQHGGCFDGEQCRAAVEQVAPVHQVPVGGLAVIGRVLAHGGHHDAVGQAQAASGRWQRQGGKKQAHGHEHSPSGLPSWRLCIIRKPAHPT